MAGLYYDDSAPVDGRVLRRLVSLRERVVLQVRRVGWWFGRVLGVRESEDSGSPRISLFWHALSMVLVGVLIFIGSATGLWLLLGRPKLAPRSPGPLTPTDMYDGIKIALTVVGGIGGVIALVVAYRRQRFSEREHARADATARREDTRLYTDRFRAASEQLGADKAAERLAGTYAMASLADDWEAGRQTCIDVLCAYVRMPSAASAKFINNGSEPEQPRSSTHDESVVRHALIKLIAEHLRPNGGVLWQGHSFDFTGAVFDRLDMSHVEFEGSTVDFSDVVFTGDASFRKAWFRGTDVTSPARSSTASN
jgi:hypothetical protein